jgi:hypothetical protein
MALVIVVAVFGRSGATGIASAARPLFKPEDQLVMLGNYQYDLAFYLRAHRPAWVVGEWARPGIARSDGWEKELLDAGQFAPALRESLLLSPARFVDRLCATRAGATWIWARQQSAAVPPWVAALPVFASDARYRFWHLTPETVSRLPVCAGTPRSDREQR